MIKNVILNLFPIDTISVVPRRNSSDLEVNGLPKGFVPQNCEILASGEEIHGSSLRTHYLVSVAGSIVFMTVCAPEFGDSLFALIRGTARLGSEEADDVIRHAHTCIAMVCGKPVLRAA